MLTGEEAARVLSSLRDEAARAFDHYEAMLNERAEYGLGHAVLGGFHARTVMGELEAHAPKEGIGVLRNPVESVTVDPTYAGRIGF